MPAVERFVERFVEVKVVLFLTHPKKRLPTKPPIQRPEAIHEASAVDIGPVSNIVSSDFSTGKLALGHPQDAP